SDYGSAADRPRRARNSGSSVRGVFPGASFALLAMDQSCGAQAFTPWGVAHARQLLFECSAFCGYLDRDCRRAGDFAGRASGLAHSQCGRPRLAFPPQRHGLVGSHRYRVAHRYELAMDCRRCTQPGHCVARKVRLDRAVDLARLFRFVKGGLGMTRWMRWIAPSAGHALRRTLLILAAGVLVLSATVAFEGWPTAKHDLHRNEERAFRADFRRGPIALLGGVVLVAVWAGLGRRVFRIRL